MTTDYYSSLYIGNWTDIASWSEDRPPVAGETVVIPYNAAAYDGTLVSVDDLNLIDNTVDLGGVGGTVGLDANTLILIDSTITASAGSNAFFYAANAVALDRMSFIGGTLPNSEIDFGSAIVSNSGTIGAEAAGSRSIVSHGNVPFGALANTGQLIASNGGQLTLDGENVTGSGQISISNGGSLTLNQTTISATQTINFGGSDNTTLSFDPTSSSVGALISGFAQGDKIDLLNFVGLAFRTSNSNPQLVLISQNPASPGIYTLQLSGNYANDSFTLATDATKTGMNLTFTHVT